MVQPLGDRVLVKPDDPKELKRGSIYIPEIARSRPQEGEVVAIGRKVQDLKVGDRVLYGKYAASEVTVDDVRYAVLREVDVMGVL